MNAPGIFYFIILLSLAGCVSKKEVVNNNALPLVIDRKDVMLSPNGEPLSKGSFDIKLDRGYKVPTVENTAATTHSSTTAASPPQGGRNPETGRLIDQKSPQARHERMMEGTSSVFLSQRSGGKMNYSNPRNFKK